MTCGICVLLSSLLWCSLAKEPGGCSSGCTAPDTAPLIQIHTSMADCDTPDCQVQLSKPMSVIGRSIPEPEETIPSKNNRLCEKDEFALGHACPANCPYAAEMANKFCHFRCVRATECGLFGTVTNNTIPSEETHACRSCNVEACKECKSGPPGAKGKALERCLECYPGYSLAEEGECEMDGLWVFAFITGVVAVVAVVLVAWYLRVVTRPCVNQAGIEFACEARCRAMVLQGDGQAYPLATNLLTANVAGVGTMCLFRFQCALLVWAAILLGLWLFFAMLLSSDLLVLGMLSWLFPCRGGRV